MFVKWFYLAVGCYFVLQLAVYVGFNDKLDSFNSGFYSWIPFSNVYGLYTFVENNTVLNYNKQNMFLSDGGSINFASMHRRFTSKLTRPYSDCDIDNTNPGHFESPYYNLILKSPYLYKQEFCVTQCMQKKAIEMCNCSIPIYLTLYNVSCPNAAASFCAFRLLFNGQLTPYIHIFVSHIVL